MNVKTPLAWHCRSGDLFWSVQQHCDLFWYIVTCSGPPFPPRPSRDRGQTSQAIPKNPQIQAEPPVHWDTPLTKLKCSYSRAPQKCNDIALHWKRLIAAGTFRSATLLAFFPPRCICEKYFWEPVIWEIFSSQLHWFLLISPLDWVCFPTSTQLTSAGCCRIGEPKNVCFCIF